MVNKDIQKRIEGILDEPDMKKWQDESITNLWNELTSQLGDRTHDIPGQLERGELEAARENTLRLAAWFDLFLDAIMTRDDFPDVKTTYSKIEAK